MDIAYGHIIFLVFFDPTINSTVISNVSYLQEKWKEMTSDDELNEMVQGLARILHSNSISRSLLSKVSAVILYPISAIAVMIKAVSLNEEQI